MFSMCEVLARRAERIEQIKLQQFYATVPQARPINKEDAMIWPSDEQRVTELMRQYDHAIAKAKETHQALLALGVDITKVRSEEDTHGH